MTDRNRRWLEVCIFCILLIGFLILMRIANPPWVKATKWTPPPHIQTAPRTIQTVTIQRPRNQTTIINRNGKKMSVTGPNICGTGADDSAVGSSMWSVPTEIQATDGTSAACTGGGDLNNQISRYFEQKYSKTLVNEVVTFCQKL